MHRQLAQISCFERVYYAQSAYGQGAYVHCLSQNFREIPYGHENSTPLN